MSETKIQAPLERKLNKEVSKAMQVRELLASMTGGGSNEDGDALEVDPQLIADMIEGETDLYEVIRELQLRCVELQGFANGTAGVIKDLSERKSRLEKSADTIRELIRLAMLKCEVKTLRTDVATFTIRDARPRLEVTDETEIPASYFVPQDPKVDKAKLLADLVELAKRRALMEKTLAEGEAINEEAFSIPGAKLVTGAPPLSVRVK